MEASEVRAENGRVLFSGDENILARANICSRFSERVLVLLGSFEAHSFEELFQGTRALPWEQWIGADDAFPVKGYSIDSDLFSVRDCQAIIKKAVENGATSVLEPELEPWGQRTCYIADPEGNLIEIGSWNKPYEEKDL